MFTAIARLAPYILPALLAASLSWFLRGALADRDMRNYQADLQAKQNDQRELTMKVEAAGVENRKASTARLDTVEKSAVADVQYVDREVIRYVTKYRDADCPTDPLRDAEWVCIYSRSLGLPCGVPETRAAR